MGMIFIFACAVDASWLSSFKNALSSAGSGALNAGLNVGESLLYGGVNNLSANMQLNQCRQLAQMPNGMFSPQYQMSCQNAPMMCMQTISSGASMDPYCASLLGGGMPGSSGLAAMGPWGGTIPGASSVSGQPGLPINPQNLGWSVPVPQMYINPPMMMGCGGYNPMMMGGGMFGGSSSIAGSLGGGLASGFLGGLLGGVGSNMFGGMGGYNPMMMGGYPSMGMGIGNSMMMGGYPGMGMGGYPGGVPGSGLPVAPGGSSTAGAGTSGTSSTPGVGGIVAGAVGSTLGSDLGSDLSKFL